MDDLDTRLRRVFSTSLGVPLATISDSTTFNKIPEWDSISHMQLIAAIDEEFGTMLDTDDIVALSSVAKAREILTRVLK